jgi:hypothetical protein
MDRPQQRGYLEAVITNGGRTAWLAGTATADDSGKSLKRLYGSILRNLDRALQTAHGKRSVTCAGDPIHHGRALRLPRIRREVFGDSFQAAL